MAKKKKKLMTWAIVGFDRRAGPLMEEKDGPGNGHHSQVSQVILAPSKAAAIRALGVSAYEFSNYALDTGNPEDLAVAAAFPGEVLWSPLDWRAPAPSNRPWFKKDGTKVLVNKGSRMEPSLERVDG